MCMCVCVNYAMLPAVDGVTSTDNIQTLQVTFVTPLPGKAVQISRLCFPWAKVAVKLFNHSCVLGSWAGSAYTIHLILQDTILIDIFDTIGYSINFWI